MTRTGDREIHSVSRRLPDNPGELAYMQKTNRAITYRLILRTPNRGAEGVHYSGN